MKFSYVTLILSTLLTSRVLALPTLESVAVTANQKLCASVNSTMRACQSSKEATLIVEKRLASMNPNDPDYKKWAEILPLVKQNEIRACAGATSLKLNEMAVAWINVDQPYLISASKFNLGDKGQITLWPSQTQGPSILVSQGPATMKIQGPLFCEALESNSGDPKAAIKTLIQNLFNNPSP